MKFAYIIIPFIRNYDLCLKASFGTSFKMPWMRLHASIAVDGELSYLVLHSAVKKKLPNKLAKTSAYDYVNIPNHFILFSEYNRNMQMHTYVNE